MLYGQQLAYNGACTAIQSYNTLPTISDLADLIRPFCLRRSDNTLEPVQI